MFIIGLNGLKYVSSSLKLRRRNHINPEWRDELYTVAAAGIKVSKLHARKSRFLDKLEKSQQWPVL